jgi:hypothetical protein
VLLVLILLPLPLLLLLLLFLLLLTHIVFQVAASHEELARSRRLQQQAQLEIERVALVCGTESGWLCLRVRWVGLWECKCVCRCEKKKEG